jgi:hypothetical protein
MNGRVGWGLVALAIAAAAGGCRSSETPGEWRYGVYRPSFGPSSGPAFEFGGRFASEPPLLALSDAQVRAALEQARLVGATRHEQALDVVARSRGASVAEVASAVAACYALGERDAAEALSDGARGVFDWDHAAAAVIIETHYRSRGSCAGGALEVSVKRRPGFEGPLAVAFPPGTYGAAQVEPVAEDRDGQRWTNPDDDRRYGRWPSQQDLAFLQAPVVILGSGEDEATLEVPIACASFDRGPPAADQLYTLGRFPKDSDVDRLLVALCARERTREPEAQLAVWLARNDISWAEFCDKGGAYGNLLTFGTGSRILPRHAKGAAKLLVEAGSDPRAARFFGGRGIERLSDQGDPPATPQPEAPVPSSIP